MLADIDMETVDFRPTYDESSVEPVVLPSKAPSLMMNGGVRNRCWDGDEYSPALRR